MNEEQWDHALAITDEEAQQAHELKALLDGEYGNATASVMRVLVTGRPALAVVAVAEDEDGMTVSCVAILPNESVMELVTNIDGDRPKARPVTQGNRVDGEEWKEVDNG